MNLANSVQAVRSSVDATVAQTAVNGTAVDMVGFDGVMFIAVLGTVSTDCVPTLKAQQSSDNGSADTFADLEGSSAAGDDGDDDDLLVVDVYRPRERYVRPVLTRAGGSTGAVLDGIIAIKYRGSKMPTAQHATEVARTVLASPAEGTA